MQLSQPGDDGCGYPWTTRGIVHLCRGTSTARDGALVASSAERSRRHREANRREDRWAEAVRSLAVRSASKQRAKGKNVKCIITVDEIRAMGERQGMRCHYSGIPFILEGGKAHPQYPSLDRTIVDGDYSAENCRLTCWMMNRGRSDMPAVEFLRTLQMAVESFATAPWTSEYHVAFLPKPPKTP